MTKPPQREREGRNGNEAATFRRARVVVSDHRARRRVALLRGLARLRDHGRGAGFGWLTPFVAVASMTFEPARDTSSGSIVTCRALPVVALMR